MHVKSSRLLKAATHNILPLLVTAAAFTTPAHAQTGLDAEDELCTAYAENVVLSYFLQKNGASKELVETALNEYFAYTYDSKEVSDFMEEVIGPSVGAVGTFPKDLTEAEVAYRTEVFDTLCRRNVALFKENGTIH